MNLWLAGAIALLVGYLLGSIPTGYLAGRILKGIDIREHGSQSTGATNVLRILGKGPAIVVLLVDMLKGVGAIALPQWLLATWAIPAGWIPWMATLAGLAALLGHSRSVWLKFTGGKSAATGLGILAAMSGWVGLGAGLVFVLVLAIGRIVSLSSITAAIASVLLMWGLHQPLPYLLFAIAGGLYVILRHRANIQRLLAGTEPKIGQKHTDVNEELNVER